MVPDMFDWLGDWVKRTWEDAIGVGLWENSGRWPAVCKLIVGLLCSLHKGEEIH